MGALSWSWRNILCGYRNTRRDSNAGIATSEFSAVCCKYYLPIWDGDGDADADADGDGGGGGGNVFNVSFVLSLFCCSSQFTTVVSQLIFIIFPLVRKIDVLPEKK